MLIIAASYSSKEKRSYLLIQARLAWGFSIKRPFVSKGQPSYTTFPPTTLIGAISYPLAKIKGSGELIIKRGKIYSVAEEFKDIFKAASAIITQEKRDAPSGVYWEDINRYQILQFQKDVRRGDPMFRFGTVPSGKVMGPGSMVRIIYLVDEEEARNVLGSSWDQILIEAGYSITRIGSRESIVSVEKVDLGEPVMMVNELCTRYPHPKDIIQTGFTPKECPDKEYNGWYEEVFWDNTYEWRDILTYRTFIVPGTRNPVFNGWIRIRLKDGVKGYLIEEDGIAEFL